MKIEIKEGLDALKEFIIDNWDSLSENSELNDDELLDFINNFNILEETFDNLENLNKLLENEAKHIK